MVGLITFAKRRKQAKPKNRLKKTTNRKNRIDTLQLALFIDIPWSLEPTWSSIAAVPGHATLSTAVAYLLYFRILASAGATNVLLVTFLIPVSALLLGVGLLGKVIQL